ncbi:hypothetical protein [Pannonibacter indicus]|uniref:Uncharacterized protein n=1 Tax=Pannonibacter indicus TaxID=466044 RepID=A0A0K6HLW9_9HYPH|nr:hypothetical protein [Pannonibacter indicus]CUA91874.1 hypothetical protein Ga0061067_101143 [Pannonibacter indicus]
MTDVETGTGVEPKAETASAQAAAQPPAQSAGEIPAVPALQVDVPKVPVPEVPVPEVPVPEMPVPEVPVPEIAVPVMTAPAAQPSSTAAASAGSVRGGGRDAGRGEGRGAGRGEDEAGAGAGAGAADQSSAAATGEFFRDLAGSGGGGKDAGAGGAATGAQLLRQLLIEHLKVAALQSGYAQVTQALPKVLAAGIEAGQRKKAADQAYEEGLAVAVKVLSSARDAAKNLSSSIQGEQETLAKLLANNEELVKLPQDAVKALSVMEQIGHNLAAQKAGLSNPIVRQGLQYQIEQMKKHLTGSSR